MKIEFDIKSIDFQALTNGLVGAIVQDTYTQQVLMLGYMNAEALEKTCADGVVCFFSRSKNRLWVKGETSGNFLKVSSIKCDCDGDALLIRAEPVGPTCHTGADTCWQETNTQNPADFLFQLESIIHKRKNEATPNSKSYTQSLFEKGINKVAQKVGEEAIELVIEAKDDNRDLFLGEAADLMFHYLVLLAAKNYSLSEVVDVLKTRNHK
jgi:phosphoribosyl-AMP cyclohydrolase / phosphoribosyl-ATP pyrophosphohydrolase